MRTLLSLFLLIPFSLRASELGPPTLVLPPRTGPAQFSTVEEIAPGGDTFVVIARSTSPNKHLGYTTSSTDPLYAVVVSADGLQVAPPILLPFQSAGAFWIGHYVVLANGAMRIAADGTLLDREPRPLTHGNPPLRVAAGDRLLLAYPTVAEFFHLDGTTTPLTTPMANLPDATIRSVATNGRDFGIFSTRAIRGYLRVLDGRGEVLRDGQLDNAAGYLQSDGKTWSVINRELTHQMLFDEDLKLVKSLQIDYSNYPYRAISGRGYYRIQPPSYAGVGIPPFPASITEARPGSYHLYRRTFQPGLDAVFRGNAARLYLGFKGTTSAFARVHVLSSLEQANALPEAVALRGPLDREHGSAAENANGMTLLVWNEASAPDRVDIFAARLSRSGAMLDAKPIPIGSGCRDTLSSVASDGTDFAIVWGSCAEGGASLVTSSGVLVPIFRQSAALTGGLAASAVFDGEAYVVTWSDRKFTTLARIARGGSVISDALWPYGGLAQLAPRAGGGVLIVYTEGSGHLSSHLLKANLEDDGPFVRLARGQATRVTPAGEGFLLQGRTYETGLGERPTLMWLTAAGTHPTASQPFNAPVVNESAHVSCEPRAATAAGCTLLWKTWSIDGAPQTLAAPIGTAANGTVAAQEPVVLATHGIGMRWGEVVLFRGTATAPKFLLSRGPDAEHGGLQFFAQNAPSKRRVVRP